MSSLVFSIVASTSVKVSAGGAGPTLNTQASGPPRGDSSISRGYREELEHWAWCIRNPAPGNRPRCYPEVAMADAIIALTTGNLQCGVRFSTRPC